MRLIMVRHGEPDYEKDCLTETGRQQAAAAAERLAAEIAAAAPGAVADAKRLVWDVWGRPVDHALMDDTARRIAQRRTSPEGQEGVRAFLGKRKPNWAL